MTKVPHVTVHGCLFPTLTFQTTPLKIIYSPSDWILKLPTQIPLTWVQAREVRHILSSLNPHVVIFFLWEKHTFDLLPIKLENENSDKNC